MQEKCIPSLGWEDSPGGGNGNPLQHSCLENSTDRGAWRAAVHGVTGSDTTEHEFTHIASPGCLYHARDLEESFKK